MIAVSDPWWLILGGAALGIACGAVSGLLIRRWWDGLGGAQTRDMVRRWWHSGIAAPPASIKIRRRDGTVEQVRPVRASGLHLMVEPLTGTRTWEMMAAGDAVDVGEFWRVWKFYGGRSSGWVDEDGDEFQPDGNTNTKG